MATLFFSYSHKDEALRDELEVQLSVLKREGAIEAWHDRRISAGDNFGGVISERLESADVILLLVSADFLASGYCYDVEFKKALERHRQGKARVIPVILRPCEWQQTPLADLLVVPKDGKPVTRWPDRDEAFLDVVKQIRAALPKSAHRESPQTHQVQTLSPQSSRSSNLRVRKQFTEADTDRFLDDTFEFMAKFFEGSLHELAERNEGIEGRFKRIDARTFSAVVYRNGEAEARCAIRYGGSHGFGSGITYSYDDKATSNSFNESLSVQMSEQNLSLKPLGMAPRSWGESRGTHLTMEGAAEYYWSLLIEPLQH